MRQIKRNDKNIVCEKIIARSMAFKALTERMFLTYSLATSLALAENFA